MGVAAGGLIKQSICRDLVASSIWEANKAVIFNLQILNSDTFSHITGDSPPPTPITARTYAAQGLRYYDIYTEKASGVYGEFSHVKSVNSIDKAAPKTAKVLDAIDQVDKAFNNPVMNLNKDGRHAGFFTSLKTRGKVRHGFRPVAEMEDEVRSSSSSETF